MAVRAVQQIPAPPLADAGDVGCFVAHPGRHQDTPCLYLPATGQADHETRLDPNHAVGDQFDAVTGRLCPPGGQEVRGRHPVARQETLHMRRWRIARLAGVDHGDPAPGPAQYQRGAQTSRSATDHNYVISRRFRSGHLRSEEYGATWRGRAGSLTRAVSENWVAMTWKTSP